MIAELFVFYASANNGRRKVLCFRVVLPLSGRPSVTPILHDAISLHFEYNLAQIFII